MKYDPVKHHRRSIRLKGYDYSQAGAYFITICTKDRACLFGEMVDGEMRLNPWGEIVREEWFKTAQLRLYVRLHDTEFVVMPNHVHGIIWIVDDNVVGARRRRAPTDAPLERFGAPVSGSIPTIVRAFKSATTKRLNALRGTPGGQIWQRNYYEHIIRDDESLNRIREYIANNPSQWAADRENPDVVRRRMRRPDRTNHGASDRIRP
jgi:REP element-mobilizing transposase RayT